MLRGAAIPGVIVAICAIVFSFVGLFVQDGDVVQTAKIGIGVGVFISLWSGIQAMLGILMSGGSWQIRLYLVLGYFLTWAVSIYLIVYGLS